MEIKREAREKSNILLFMCIIIPVLLRVTSYSNLDLKKNVLQM